MTKARLRTVIGALVVTIALTAVAATWLVTRSTPQQAPAATQRAVYKVERRPFKAVVTLDATVAAAAPVAVTRQRQGNAVAWSVKTGDVVKAGQALGTELPSSAEPGSGQAAAGSDLAHARRQLQRLKKTSALDIADAEEAVRKAPPAGRPAAQRALVRARLAAQQAMDDLQKQISAMRRALAAPDGKRTKLTAPVAGEISIAPDGAAATVQPAGHLIVAPVDPLVLYRLLDDSGQPTSTSNTVRLTGLATAFECAGLRLQGNVTAAASPPVNAEGEAANTPATAAACRVPKGIRVFAGLKATLAVTVADMPEALVLDAAGVRASTDDKGLVSQLDPEGRVVTRGVRLGQTDGLSVVILAGLREGDEVVDASAN